MKIFFTIFLTLSVLLQSISGSILVFKFQAQKKYIAEKLCENRNNPQKGCAGKCFLKKMLKKQEEAEKALPGSIKEKMEAAYILQIPFKIEFTESVLYSEPSYSYNFFIPASPFFKAIQPPRV
ncbi:MAG: hypothetical protein H7329_15445 [Opitutaceae bacterium]|nr:hypothetical protein [Cytophagales bacterium]